MSSTEEYSFETEFQAVFLPKQKPPPPPVPKEDRMGLSTYPPLGQVTQTASGEVVFHALLEVDQSRGAEPWQVSLWHTSDKDGQAWTETLLSRSEDGNVPSALQPLDESLVRIYFSALVPVQPSLYFTLKFREAPERDWQWVRDEQGHDDGVVVVNTKETPGNVSEKLGDIIKDLNPTFKVKSGSSQCPGTQLWSLEATVGGAVDDESSFTDVDVGLPWGDFLRWFALVRIWTPWLAPRHGKSRFELDKEAVLCSFLSPSGRHLVLLAISGVNDVMTVFRSNDSGRVVLNIRNDGVGEETATVLAAVGDDCESAIATVMYEARSLVQAIPNPFEKEIQSLQNDVKPEWIENWYDGLGFCTWNALGQRLTDEKVFKAVDTLAENNIKIVSLIIDDNWQSIDYHGDGQFQHGWKDFEAEPNAFPKGLKATISNIRSKHPNIQHIAVWHALLGYWAGISPEGSIAKTYKTTEVDRGDAKRRNLPIGGKMTVVAKEDIHRFYDDFYKFLASCGVDGVKTDAQFMMDMWVSAKARREMITTYQDAWTISSLRYFSIKAISCMSQIPQILFHSQLPRNRPAMLCRNSDDFFPNIASSHPWHVWANAHNSLLTQHLNILPDWDMFQTVHSYSEFHAAARCVSGGPIYITDVPGAHNIDLIRQMTGVTPRGKTVIFRPSVLGRSIDQYVGYDDNSLLKVGSYHGASLTGTSILGVFNISTQPLTDLIPLARFPGVVPATHYYVVRAHGTGRLTQPVQPGSPAALLAVSLGVRGHEIFSAYPLSAFESAGGARVYATNLGLVGKMAAAAAIVGSSFEQQQNGRVLLVSRTKALGVLGLYISRLPDMTVEENFLVTIQGTTIPPHTVSVSKQDSHVLEIDTEAAWNEMRLQPGWSNEVEVKVYFSIDP